MTMVAVCQLLFGGTFVNLGGRLLSDDLSEDVWQRMYVLRMFKISVLLNSYISFVFLYFVDLDEVSTKRC